MRFIPRDDAGREAWLTRFAAGVGKYAALLNLAPEYVAQAATDAAAYSFIVKARQAAEAYNLALTAWRNALRDGGTLGALVPPPDPGPAPASARPGIIARSAWLAKFIKTNCPQYTKAIGVELGIISAKKQIGDLATIAPQLTVRLVAGRPVIGWRKGRMTGIEIHADRTGTGTFEKVDDDFSPPYRDRTPLPPPGTAAIWTYRAIYLLRDDRVGQWSNSVRITVAGM